MARKKRVSKQSSASSKLDEFASVRSSQAGILMTDTTVTPANHAYESTSKMLQPSAPEARGKAHDPFGEMGRCLLSSTMLRNGRGIRATFEHFERAGLLNPTLRAQTCDQRKPTGGNVETYEKSLGKPTSKLPYKSLQAKQICLESSNEPDKACCRSNDKETKAANALRCALIQEFAEFVNLAQNDVALLTAKLEQQRRHNLQVRKRVLKRQTDLCHDKFKGNSTLLDLAKHQITDRPADVDATLDRRSPARMRRKIMRWNNPLASGYDSDSTTISASTVTTTDATELELAGLSSLRGKKIFRHILDTPNGLSRSEMRLQAQVVLSLLNRHSTNPPLNVTPYLNSPPLQKIDAVSRSCNEFDESPPSPPSPEPTASMQALDAPKRHVIVTALQLLQRHLECTS